MQKALTYPSGITMIRHSLNIRESEPIMIILADATDEIKRDMHELHPSSIYEIGDDGYSKG